MKLYPAYKDSGIEWIGNIPKTWQVKRLKFLCSLINQPGTLNGNGKRIDLENIESWTGKIKSNGSDTSIADDEMKTYKLGDVLFSKLRPYLAKVYKARENGICGGELLVLRPGKEMRSGFVFYRTISNDFIRIVDGSTYGTKMPRADWDFIGNLFMGYPDPETQEIVTTFLDRKTVQIDDLTAKKERMIELLKEERSAVINHTVTRGLDLKVELSATKKADPSFGGKDSGIEWLGKVPKHWEIKKLKFVAKLKSGESINSDLIHEQGNYPVYGGNGLRGCTNSYTHEGDYVLIGRQGALCGNINYANGKFWASEHAVVVTMLSNNNCFWLGELLRVMNLNRYSQSAAQPGLAVDNIQNLYAPCPPTTEQERIVLFLREKTAQIDDQIEREKKSIELLKEYRTALISEVVTGKVDVRQEVS